MTKGKNKNFSKKEAFLFFEGSEKKLEIIVQSKNLKTLSKSFWKKLIQKSKASALSHIENDLCEAYLLSESSLFIWKDRLTMITCGKTTLIESALFFIDFIKKENIRFLIYERKNESFPLHQSSDFYQDIKKLKKKIKGKAFLMGENAGHHLLFFQSENKYLPPMEDSTFEILMYNFEKEVKKIFQPSQWNKKDIKKLTCFDSWLPGFKKDEYFFEPSGYSLNAIKDNKYYTLHITREASKNIYISFETNMYFKNEKIQTFLKNFLSRFKPLSFDFILLKPLERTSNQIKKNKEEWKNLSFKLKNYEKILPSYYFLGNSYKIHFCHFFRKLKSQAPAKLIEF